MGPKNVPFLTTHDGRTIRYPDPMIKVNDTIRLDIATSTIIDFIKFDTGIISDLIPIYFYHRFAYNFLIFLR